MVFKNSNVSNNTKYFRFQIFLLLKFQTLIFIYLSYWKSELVAAIYPIDSFAGDILVTKLSDSPEWNLAMSIITREALNQLDNTLKAAGGEPNDGCNYFKNIMILDTFSKKKLAYLNIGSTSRGEILSVSFLKNPPVIYKSMLRDTLNAIK